MKNLSKPLSEKELDRLDKFLLDCREEEEFSEEMDEGIFEISGLDGFFTALASGPSMVPPSQWLKSVWGDVEPVWNSEKEFKRVFALLLRYMNQVGGALEDPDNYAPLFYQRKAAASEDGPMVVDEWCEGYMRGVELDPIAWASGGDAITALLEPIRGFTQAAGWPAHEGSIERIIERQHGLIATALEIHAFWRPARGSMSNATGAALSNQPVAAEPRVGRNDPCPCGSGKKYKKCCLQ